MITEDIRYIGVNDHDIDLFEGQYQVPNGISYNSYWEAAPFLRGLQQPRPAEKTFRQAVSLDISREIVYSYYNRPNYSRRIEGSLCLITQAAVFPRPNSP